MDTDLLERTKVLTLTTTGRVTGEPHPVELWFVYLHKARAIYLLSYAGQGQQGTDWCQNVLAHPQVDIKVRGEKLNGTVEPAPEEDLAQIEERIRGLFAQKYGPAMISHYYGEGPNLPLKIKLADVD